MSNVKRPNTKTLLSYNFSSKKIQSDAENLTPSTNTPVATTITTNDDASTLLSSSDLENSVQLNDEVNFSVANKFRYGTLKDSTAESWYHAIINFQHIISTCISCFLLSEIIPTSRLLQTETLDFSSANRCVDDLLDTLDQRKQQAQDYVHNVIYSHADALRKELFVTPSIPSHSTLAMRKQNMSVCDPEMFYCDYVYLPYLDELVNNVKSRLSGLKGERIVLLSKLRPEVIINEKLFELTKHLLKQFASRLLSPLQLSSELE
ncbi:unnamed protein product [Rotaria sp. Silwood2]|nr:unnamed protein product [Rotaria sp. Silwood2]